jgi:hypothetical protein
MNLMRPEDAAFAGTLAGRRGEALPHCEDLLVSAYTKYFFSASCSSRNLPTSLHTIGGFEGKDELTTGIAYTAQDFTVLPLDRM